LLYSILNPNPNLNSVFNPDVTGRSAIGQDGPGNTQHRSVAYYISMSDVCAGLLSQEVTAQLMKMAICME